MVDRLNVWAELPEVAGGRLACGVYLDDLLAQQGRDDLRRVDDARRTARAQTQLAIGGITKCIHRTCVRTRIRSTGMHDATCHQNCNIDRCDLKLGT
jgi:hypothetical protein